MANFTSGAPVQGNLTLKATIRPIGWFNPKSINQQFRVWNTGYQQEEDRNNPYNYQNNKQQNEIYGPSVYGPNVDQNMDQRFTQNTYQDMYVVEKHFNFDEAWPFWLDKPERRNDDHWSDAYSNHLPYLRFFNGTYEFRYPMNELEKLVPTLAGMEVLITARVGERFYDEIIEGYSIARVYNSSIKVSFMGDTPQVFKPTMPFTAYIVAEYHDGSKLPLENYYQGTMEVCISYITKKKPYPNYIIFNRSVELWTVDLGADETIPQNLLKCQKRMEFGNCKLIYEMS